MPAAHVRELIERDVGLLGVGQRHRDGEVGDRERIADQIASTVQVVVQHFPVPAKAGRRPLDRLRIRRAGAKALLDDVLEVECAAIFRDVLKAPAKPANGFGLGANLAARDPTRRVAPAHT